MSTNVLSPTLRSLALNDCEPGRQLGLILRHVCGDNAKLFRYMRSVLGRAWSDCFLVLESGVPNHDSELQHHLGVFCDSLQFHFGFVFPKQLGHSRWPWFGKCLDKKLLHLFDWSIGYGGHRSTHDAPARRFPFGHSLIPGFAGVGQVAADGSYPSAAAICNQEVLP